MEQSTERVGSEHNATTNLLVPPVVTHLKDEAAADRRLERGQMERTASQDMREERQDLKEAAEQTLNVVLDLGLNGVVRWVSPSWQDVVGTSPAEVLAKPIADLLLDHKTVFAEAVESMQKDDSRSQIIRFSVAMGPASKLDPDISDMSVQLESETSIPEEPSEQSTTLTLEGQGIMVYDRSSGGQSHTMWMLRPPTRPREITIDLPGLLVDSLGVGAEMLAQYLTKLAEVGANDPANHAPPLPVLCRICERQIPPWWFEKHSDLCLQEHKAEMEVQMSHEALTEHRNAIVKVLDALEVRNSRPTSGDIGIPTQAQAEYKGLPIGFSPATSNSSSGTASPAIPPTRSRDPSTTGTGHVRARSFAIRRPLSRIVELVLDLCDTAIEITTPAIRDSPSSAGGEMRTQSPQSESRISQVLQWQSPSTNTLEQERGLALLCNDTENVTRAKVEAVLRHRRILEYSERIRVEFTLLVQDCIDEAMRKAARIAAGDLSDSTEGEPEVEAEDDDDDETPAPKEAPFPGSFDGPSSLAQALRTATDPNLLSRESSQLSAAASSRSSSPKECPTPRSHRTTMSSRAPANPSKRSSIYLESDAGDSDTSVRSSILSGVWRTDSPGSEIGLSRATSSRDRHRRSLILPGTSSPHRQPSPGRGIGPPSPLKIGRPRLADAQEGFASPVTSPLLSGGELSSPIIASRHHRRQSSTTSEVLRPPVSPRLTSVNQPQAKAVAPSIKDFEIIKPISKGAFGSVYLSKKKSTGDYFAIKVLKKTDMVAKNQVTNVKAERAIMMWQGQSDFVAKLYWTFSSKDYLYLVMEYLNGGDCASLVKVLGGLPEDWAKKYLAEVVLGLEHLHGRGIVHRDLKPDNLLIDQHGHLKLTDFGLSRMGLIGRQKRILNSNANEMAPDLLKQGPFVRAMSMASSRSTSFDLQGNHSPGSTPQMTPDLAGGLGLPSYFNLNRDHTLSREHSRHASGHRSDSGGSESLSAMFGSFSLSDSNAMSQSQRRMAIEEETNSDDGGSPDPYGLQPITSHSSAGQNNTPPQSSMMPPPMALFDPEDSNRRFVGTPDYLAPETINGVGQDEMSDWWSLGCILFEFLHGYPPFHADSPDKVFANILGRKIDWPDPDVCSVSAEARDIMDKLMCISPRERLGSNLSEKYASGGREVRSHAWFSGINWDTLLQDEAQFVPSSEDPENTEYFDARGATLQAFAEELEDQASSPAVTPGAEYADRPHDALSKVRTQVNSIKRGLMPLHIPPHVRDSRSRRLSEPVASDDFGNFTFKNLPVLEKANKDVIQKLRAEAMQAQSKQGQTGNTSAATSPVPCLEGSPVLPMPLKRQMSASKGNRPASPSNLSQANSSPSRASNPSSPLLVSFTTGQHGERRKTSSTSSTLSHQSSGSLQPGSFFDAQRVLGPGVKASSAATSPIKSARPSHTIAISPQKSFAPRQSSGPTSRARSQTVGSQESDSPARDLFVHQKRRSGVFDMSPSSSDNEDSRASALLRVRRRRHASRRVSQITLADGPVFRPLDVLICEDHPVSRMVMDKLLEKLHCRTITVNNGMEATRYAMSEVKFDIIMMEFKLPHINGADVARMIRDTKNANSQTPIVAVTGYLKELQAPHHFDAMIEKPPTTSKLIEVISRLCQWKAPAPGASAPVPAAAPSSGLRQESARSEDSPSSTSSGYVHVSGGTFPGSSRADSISSSFFGDGESMVNDDVPVIINPQANEEWHDNGLGISEEAMTEPKNLTPLPNLIHQQSAPPAMQTRLPMRPRSPEKTAAKREAQEAKAQAGGESGDDEDEELGHVQVRTRSPPRKGHRGSKLGTEMMRANSRGSVISASELSPQDQPMSGIDTVAEQVGELSGETPATITPPEIFPRSAGDAVADVDMDTTPRPSGAGIEVLVEEPTPKPKLNLRPSG
ncbi:MAG: rim15, signal transduction response regulator [Caeruleum heppii]|nr:MAG: rim15, signal transduction response regulator [Caeruleum heppii]